MGDAGLGEPALGAADLSPLKALHRTVAGHAPRGPKAKNARWVYERIRQLDPTAAEDFLAAREAEAAPGAGGRRARRGEAAELVDALDEASPTAGQALAGALVCTSQLQGSARTALFAFVLEQGGQCSARLDSCCTHLVLRKPAGAKYRFARQHGIHTVSPEFVAECVERGERVDEARFAVGSRVRKPPTGLAASPPAAAAAVAAPAAKVAAAAADRLSPPPQRQQQRDAATNHASAQLPRRDFLHGTSAVIYIGDSFGTSRAAVCEAIRQAGAQPTLSHCSEGHITHALCAHRDDAYFSSGQHRGSGVEDTRAVNPLWWQACIDRHELVSSESMKCYRPPGSSGPVPGMEKVSCTVSGFSGDDRVDIRNLLQLVGAKFSGTMKRGETTHLICAESAQSGLKYEKAKQWGVVKIVRVAWIQQVFEQWLHVDESAFLLNQCDVQFGVPAAPQRSTNDAEVATSGAKMKRERQVDPPSQSSEDGVHRKKKKSRSRDSHRNGDNQATGSEQTSARADDLAEHVSTYQMCSEDEAGFFFLLSGGKSAQKEYMSQIHAVDAKLQVSNAAACDRAVVCNPPAHGYDYRCTHLVMPELKRTQKFLCGVAGGVWVLKPSFLVAAVQCGSFAAVDPQEHEWYGAGVLQIPNSTGIWYVAFCGPQAPRSCIILSTSHTAQTLTWAHQWNGTYGR